MAKKLQAMLLDLGIHVYTGWRLPLVWDAEAENKQRMWSFLNHLPKAMITFTRKKEETNF